MQNSRSRSVPEGLSTYGEQCTCKPAAISREFVYLPRAVNTEHNRAVPSTQCQQHFNRDAIIGGSCRPTINTDTRFRRQRSKSLSRPHFVEQITTSV